MNHPFDEIAVEAARAALRWRGLRLPKGDINAALSAAFKSARDRGVARDGFAYRHAMATTPGSWGAYTGGPPNGSNIEDFPVTIIRHKENEHGK